MNLKRKFFEKMRLGPIFPESAVKRLQAGTIANKEISAQNVRQLNPEERDSFLQSFPNPHGLQDGYQQPILNDAFLPGPQ